MSRIVSQYTYTLHTFAEEEALEGLTYTIVDVHFPGVYGLCRDQLLRFRDGWALGEEPGEVQLAETAELRTVVTEPEVVVQHQQRQPGFRQNGEYGGQIILKRVVERAETAGFRMETSIPVRSDER